MEARFKKLAALTNTDIDYFFRDIPYFRETIPLNLLKERKTKYTECGVINLDSYDEEKQKKMTQKRRELQKRKGKLTQEEEKSLLPGTHWVAYYIPKQGNCEYFDSLGLPPPEEVIQYLKKAHRSITYSSFTIQSKESVLCGYYCVLFLIERLNKISYLDFLYQFHLTGERLERNDVILLKKLRKYIYLF
jgi:hypothetical protein